MSRDLRFGIFGGLLDHAPSALGCGHRTPGPFIGPAVDWDLSGGISDDGTIAWYRVVEPAGLARPTSSRSPRRRSMRTTSATSTVSASGRHLLRRSTSSSVQTSSAAHRTDGPTRLQLIRSATNPERWLRRRPRRRSLPHFFTEIHLAATRPVFWAAEVRAGGQHHRRRAARRRLRRATSMRRPCPWSSGTRWRVKRLDVEPDLATGFVDSPTAVERERRRPLPHVLGDRQCDPRLRSLLVDARGAARGWSGAPDQASDQRRRQGDRRRPVRSGSAGSSTSPRTPSPPVGVIYLLRSGGIELGRSRWGGMVGVGGCGGPCCSCCLSWSSQPPASRSRTLTTR